MRRTSLLGLKHVGKEVLDVEEKMNVHHVEVGMQPKLLDLGGCGYESRMEDK